MRRVVIALGSVLALAAAAVAAMRMLPAVPASLVMATGTTGLAYYNFGQRYRDILAGDGLTVVVEPTSGSRDNLDRLRHTDPRRSADVALIQGGIIRDDEPGIESLGTVFYEPLWLFRRRPAAGDGRRDLRGRSRAAVSEPACRHDAARHRIVRRGSEGINGLHGRTIAIGPDGSGIQPLACELLRRHGLTRGSADLRPMTTRDAIAGLAAGSVDALFIVASYDAPEVQRLLHDPGVELVGYPQADAYADSYPWLHKVTVHRGAIDLASDQPAADVTLIAAKASLIVRADVPATTKYLLMKAARLIHGQRTILQGNDEFPSAEAATPPLGTTAQQFYKPGLPYYLNSFLLDRLPFWLAGPVAAVVIPALILLTTLGVVAPLVRVVPVLYNFVTQRPVMRLLLEVMALEARLDAGGGDAAGDIARRLKELEQQATRRLVRGVPASLTVSLLVLRQHIEALRRRLGPGA